ncbi:MAG: hypothetical protein JSV65_03240 [Armatimonadota bacterium]|nr:MAG: hypothetical protein JSV65_03240 [Armatimonadota bacterium]
MICPNCLSEQPEWADSCLECGASLAFLRDHPRRVGVAIWACLILGLGLLVDLLARLLAQAVTNVTPVFGWLEAVELGLGIIFSLLASGAWATLRDMVLQRFPSRARR